MSEFFIIKELLLHKRRYILSINQEKSKFFLYQAHEQRRMCNAILSGINITPHHRVNFFKIHTVPRLKNNQ